MNFFEIHLNEKLQLIESWEYHIPNYNLVLFKILKNETFSCLENVALVKLNLVIYQCPKAQHVTFWAFSEHFFSGGRENKWFVYLIWQATHWGKTRVRNDTKKKNRLQVFRISRLHSVQFCFIKSKRETKSPSMNIYPSSMSVLFWFYLKKNWIKWISKKTFG